MNKFKITVTTTLLGLSLMSLSTYSYELTLEQSNIQVAMSGRVKQAALEMGAGNYSKAIEYAEPVANTPIKEFNQHVIAGAQAVLGYSYFAKKNKKKSILWFQKACKNGDSDSCEVLEKIKK
ncbi:SEL1-like repeat protein [Haemophilus haemolyticus]|uniref:SEL1-like repeat protein n=1 Tax=Haemophilus haemolyticus TaxID=726 RepID=UPI000E0CEA26|nr:SEL1-like repeat protein [Haemophilus haemolyticus]